MPDTPGIIGGAPNPEPDDKNRPYSVQLRLNLTLLILHFKSSRNLPAIQSQLESSDRVLRRILSSTLRDPEVRTELGTDGAMWADMAETLNAAAVALMERCYAPKPADSSSNNNNNNNNNSGGGGGGSGGGSSSNSGGTSASSADDGPSVRRIVANYAALTHDLPRLETLVGIARNVLTVGQAAQNAAAKARIDGVALRLVTLCIKVTARGFTADGSVADEDKWQAVIDLFKRLLQKCLQVLHNIIMQNERRKLMLWVELFDSMTDCVLSQAFNDLAVDELSPEARSLLQDVARPTESRSNHSILTKMASEAQGRKGASDLVSNPFLLYFGSVGTEVKKDLVKQGKPCAASDIAAECRTRWENSSPEDRQEWIDFYNRVVAKYKGNRFPKDPKFELTNEVLNHLEDRIDQEMALPQDRKQSRSKESDPRIPEPSNFSPRHQCLSAKADVQDYKMTYSPDFGAAILQQGKSDLLKRLGPDNDKAAGTESQQPTPKMHDPPQPLQASEPESQVEASSEPPPAYPQANLSDGEDSEEDDYIVPGDMIRGLLTDVCLILGPGEVEVLPMIIQSGIVPPLQGKPGYGSSPSEASAIRNMHTVRCHLLLAQENGRNLLRELLIFVAAWDLREDELFFKLMMNIMQAVLLNGLLPFSYSAFREPRETVSPAQAVIMKLATAVFRKRQADDKERAKQAPSNESDKAAVVAYPQKVDVQMVNFLLTEFRRVIVPQTCALMFLQGQIRNGTVCPEDFPMTLWDMERIYEGIYQYLEFFAILTEHGSWKNMMTEWQITSELVTLLEELHANIPRSSRSQDAAREASGHKPKAQGSSQPSKPVSVERPYDTEPASLPTIAASSRPPHNSADNYPTGIAEDEPSHFEWRNLKKLAVLVLSSLAWQNRGVQAQLAAADLNGAPGRGLRALLNCMVHDDFNPYVKEHALMALRFALEGSEENQQIFQDFTVTARQLAVGRGKMVMDGIEIPPEVMDLNAYETVVDANGHVQLRRKARN